MTGTSDTVAIRLPKDDINTIYELRDREANDLRISREPAYQRSVAVLDRILASSDESPGTNDRLKCVYIGSRIGTTVHAIASSVAVLAGGSGPVRPDERRIHRSLLKTEFKELEWARDAAKRICGWYDDTLVGNGIEKLLLTGPQASEDELSDLLKEFTGTPGLYHEEAKAVARG